MSRAVYKPSTYPEAELLELVSAGKIRGLISISTGRAPIWTLIPWRRGELIEVSAMPLSREQDAALIQSRLPENSTANHESPRGSRKAKKAFSGYTD
jgi:hypothetical protein